MEEKALNDVKSGGIGGPRKQHPYLFFNKQELKKIRARFESPPQSYYLKALIRHADGSGKGAAGGGTYLWAYLLTGRKKYRKTCMDWVKSEWGRRDFSGEWIGFRINRMAQAYDALYSELSEKARKKMKKYLVRALDAHLGKMTSWGYRMASNTIPTQCGATGMAALALLWESPKAGRALKATRKKLSVYASRCLSPDGGYIEGTLYWSFGVSYYLGFAHAFHNTTGDAGLLRHPRLKRQFRFAETLLGGDGQFMPFNDTQPWLNAWPVCADLGRRTENELLLWLADYMAAVLAGERNPEHVNVNMAHSYPPWVWVMMTQSDPGPTRRAGREFPGVPTLSVLKKMEWGVMRSSGKFIPNMVVGVKGSGGRLTHHAQNDLGSFVLYAGGEMLLLDPGYYQGNARCHTLPLINGKGPRRSGSHIVTARENDDWRVIVLDSTEAYGDLARRVRRILVMYRDRALVVLDDIVPTDNKPITAQFQVAHKPDMQTGKRCAVIKGRKETLLLSTFGPSLRLQAKKRKFGKSWGFQKAAENGALSWYSLTGRYEARSDTPLVSAMVPVAHENNTPSPTLRRLNSCIEVRVMEDVYVRFHLTEKGWALHQASPPPPQSEHSGGEVKEPPEWHAANGE